MPADASIYSMIRQPTPQPGPMDQYGQVLQMRHLMGQGQLQDLQRQQLERGVADDARVRDLFARGNVKPEEVMAIDPKTGMAYQKNMLENQKTEADLNKTRIETHGIQVKQLRDQLATVSDDAGLAQVKEAALKLYGPQAVASFPPSVNDPSFGPWQEKNIMDADALLKKVEAQKGRDVTLAGQKETARHNTVTEAEANRHNLEGERDSWQHIETPDGVVAFNPKTKKTVVLTGPDGKPIQGGKGLNEAQGKAAGMAMRAQTAHDLLNDLETGGTSTPSLIKMGVERVPVVGGALGMVANKYAASPTQQQVDQAQRDFVNAALRVESGASINDSEFANARKQYFTQPGDDQATIEQKRRNRETEIESLKMQAGPQAQKALAEAKVAADKRRKGPMGGSDMAKGSGVDVAKLSDAELMRELGIKPR